MKAFSVDVDHNARVVTIQGIKYAFDLFDHLGFTDPGTVLRIENRSDGVVTLSKIEDKPDVG